MALVAWPLICLAFFITLSFRDALILTIFGGYLCLPEGTKLNIISHPDKSAIISISALLGWILFHSNNKKSSPLRFIWFLMIFLFIFTPIATVIYNDDPIKAAHDFIIPGMTYYDGIAIIVDNFLTIIPFIIGLKFFSEPIGHYKISKSIIIAMMVYSLLIILEIRISPQLHRWVYGFYPFSFGQSARSGGFRSSVFLKHGLVLALFVSLACVSLAASSKSKLRILANYRIFALTYLFSILLLEKSLGAIVLAIIFSTVALLGNRKRIYFTAIVSIIIIFYPVIRVEEVLPLESIGTLAGKVSSDRQGSFQYRLDNEKLLLQKARYRPYFGWGSWGRNRVYSEDENQDISVTDGMWIIEIGSYGWVGYLCMFGLISIPLLKLPYLFRENKHIPPETSTLALLLALNLCDLIPNSSLTPITWLMAGALAGTYRIGRIPARGEGSEARIVDCRVERGLTC